MKRLLLSVALLCAAVLSTANADDFKPEEDFTSLFNGKDLTGWEYGPVPVSKKPIIEKLEGMRSPLAQIKMTH